MNSCVYFQNFLGKTFLTKTDRFFTAFPLPLVIVLAGLFSLCWSLERFIYLKIYTLYIYIGLFYLFENIYIPYMAFWHSLCEKCPNTVFSLVRTFPYMDWIRRDTEYLSPSSVRIRENTDQKKLRIWKLFTQRL